MKLNIDDLKKKYNKEFFMKNKMYIALGGVMIVLVIALIIASIAGKKASQNSSDNEVVTDEAGNVIDQEESTEPNELVKLEDDSETDGVTTLVTSYFKALQECDVETLSTLVVSADDISESQIKSEGEFIEGYNNIECYTKNGPEDNSYVVFVYQEMKFAGIETAAPALVRFYVVSDEDGNLLINNGELTDDESQFIAELSGDSDVASLMKTVETKYQEALTNDATLKAFVEKLSSAVSENTTQTADGESTEAEGTSTAEEGTTAAESESTTAAAESTESTTAAAETSTASQDDPE